MALSLPHTFAFSCLPCIHVYCTSAPSLHREVRVRIKSFLFFFTVFDFLKNPLCFGPLVWLIRINGHLVAVIGPSLSEPHTSGTALKDSVYVGLLAYVHVCVAIYELIQMYTNISNFHTRAKALQNSCSVQVYTMDPSLSNSPPMYLLNATEDFSPCNVTQHR